MADHDKEIDEISGTATTGHEWDGIKELNTPLPRWWLWTFIATIVWSVGYCIAYPAIPLINSATSGVLGYSSRAELAQKVEAAKQANAGVLKEIVQQPLGEIRKKPDLLAFAIQSGESAYKVNCIQCHGTGAAGGRGYPNLNDDDWLWGGKLEDIHTTLEHGIRFASDGDTRESEMPAFGRDGVLEKPAIRDLAQFVRKLAGLDHDQDAAKRAEQPFADNCASCHGEKGEGNRELGAPRLNDAIWLYGSGAEDIYAQIYAPKQGVMPAWKNRLDAVTIKTLAIYIHSLGGGE